MSGAATLVTIAAVGLLCLVALYPLMRRYPWWTFGSLLLVIALTSSLFQENRMLHLRLFQDLLPIGGRAYWYDLLTPYRLLVALLVLTVFNRARRKEVLLRLRGAEWPMALFALWVTGGVLLQSHNVFFGLHTALDAFVLSFAAFWSMRRLVHGDYDQEAFRRCLLILALVVCGWVAIERITADLVIEMTSSQIVHYRVHGPFFRATWLGPVLVTLYFGVLSRLAPQLQAAEKRWYRSSWVALLALPMALVLTLTRGLVAGFAIPLVALAVTSRGARRCASLAALALMAGVLILVVWTGSANPIVRGKDGEIVYSDTYTESNAEPEARPGDLSPADFDVSSLLLERVTNSRNLVYRWAIWKAVVEFGLTQPFTGIGLHNTRDVLTAVREGPGPKTLGPTVHCSHLMLLAETGLVGLSLYLAVIFGIARAASAGLRAPDEPSRWQGAVLLAATAAYQLPALLDDYLYLPGLPNLLFFALAGAILGRDEGSSILPGSGSNRGPNSGTGLERSSADEMTTSSGRDEPTARRTGVLLPAVVNGGRKNSAQYLTKRVLDALLSALLLVVLLPLFFVISLLIRLDSPGPAVFVQKRVGARRRRSADGRVIWEIRHFDIYKFRSMAADAEESIHRAHVKALVEGAVKEPGSGLKLKEDSRVTRIGKILRKTGLDELPQLLNVMKGEMSLVGPRPVPLYEAAEYQPAHFERLAALPGITGPWQLQKGEVSTFCEMIEMDIDYVRNSSLLLDLRILCRTVSTILLTQAIPGE